MAETVQEVYANAAGLLAQLGYHATARAEPPALVTDAPPIVIGYAIGQVAIDPEPFLPNHQSGGGKVPGSHGRLYAWSVTP